MLELLQMLPRIQWGRIRLPFCYHEANPQECFTGAPCPASAPLLQSPGQAVDRDSQQGLENFPLAVVFSFPKDSQTLKH